MSFQLQSLSNQADLYKKLYPAGTRLMLEYMNDPWAPVPSGTRGTVVSVDDAGQLHMRWDNGRTLALVPGEDGFRKLTEKELAAEALDSKANFLVDFFGAQLITMSVDVVDGQLVAKDDEGNEWVDGAIYDFALNECLCFEADGSLSSGLAAAEPFVERLKKDAKDFGVEITAHVTTVDEKLASAVERSEATGNSDAKCIDFVKE